MNIESPISSKPRRKAVLAKLSKKQMGYNTEKNIPSLDNNLDGTSPKKSATKVFDDNEYNCYSK
jgi:hypothetical protein